MRDAESLLSRLGVTSPEDIDVDAIALCVGAQVFSRRLLGCEAKIIGCGDKAVIFIRDDASPRRRRFSVGHELGHWHHHRGQSFTCRASDIGQPPDPSSVNVERVADRYAADFLFPDYLFKPALAASAVTMDGIVALAERFNASITATAIRVLGQTRDPVILVAHRYLGSRWQKPSLTVFGLSVRHDIDPRSSVSALLGGKSKFAKGRKEPANYWFNRKHIEQHDVWVESVVTHEGEVLSIVKIIDPKMLEVYN